MDGSRKKLTKLLGKKLEYTATFHRYEGSKALLTGVKHKGKEYSDHVWVGYCYALQGFKTKTKIGFRATAETYKDKRGMRKHGLSRCHNYHVDEEAFDTMKHDERQRYLRSRK